MAGSGVNQAVTKDGDTYNKLQRPQDYLTASTVPPRPWKSPLSDSAFAGKRKREQADASSQHKRTRVEQRAAQKETVRGSDKNNKRSRIREGGLIAALPGLDDEEHAPDDPLDDALAYMRSVRTEASTIPSLLVAQTCPPTFSHKDEDAGTQSLLFTDGVCLAVEDVRSASNTDEYNKSINDSNPENAFTQQLLKRFYNLRRTLGSIGIEDVAHLTRTSLGTTKDALDPKTRSAWPGRIDHEDPYPSEIVHMNDTTLYSGLQYCARKLEESNTISLRTSRWMWALLATVGDAGTLDNKKISKIRDLGLKTGLLGVKLRNGNSHVSCSNKDVSAEEHHDSSQVVHSESKESICRHSVQPETRTASEPTVSAECEKSRDVEKGQHGDGDSAQLLQNLGLYTKAPLENIDEFAAEVSTCGINNEVRQCAKASDLEEARARLLAQLGDRLVQAQFPSLEGLVGTHHASPASSHSQSKQLARDLTPLLNIHQGADRSIHGDGHTNWSDSNTRVTIEMVITVVAECFGQRDLLTYREGW